jgi:hypothetical protein
MGVTIRQHVAIRAIYDARIAGNTRFGELERRFIHDVADDMSRNPPLLIVVDMASVPQSKYHGFAGLRYFQQDPRFAALLSEYDRVADVRRYRIFRRNRRSAWPTMSR